MLHYCVFPFSMLQGKQQRSNGGVVKTGASLQRLQQV